MAVKKVEEATPKTGFKRDATSFVIGGLLATLISVIIIAVMLEKADHERAVIAPVSANVSTIIERVTLINDFGARQTIVAVIETERSIRNGLVQAGSREANRIHKTVIDAKLKAVDNEKRDDVRRLCEQVITLNNRELSELLTSLR